MPRKRASGETGRGGETPRPGEIYIEFKQVGQAFKVNAVDAATGEEVSIMGPASAARSDLERIAVRKLKRKLGRGEDQEP